MSRRAEEVLKGKLRKGVEDLLKRFSIDEVLAEMGRQRPEFQTRLATHGSGETCPHCGGRL